MSEDLDVYEEFMGPILDRAAAAHGVSSPHHNEERFPAPTEAELAAVDAVVELFDHGFVAAAGRLLATVRARLRGVDLPVIVIVAEDVSSGLSAPLLMLLPASQSEDLIDLDMSSPLTQDDLEATAAIAPMFNRPLIDAMEMELVQARAVARGTGLPVVVLGAYFPAWPDDVSLLFAFIHDRELIDQLLEFEA